LVVRVSLQTNCVLIEAASTEAGTGQSAIDGIVELSARRSIYRGHLLELSTEAADQRLHVAFSKLPSVGADDIILDEKVREILVRNIVDVHNRRDELARRGVPAGRGVLFYGPPGTGKTFAVRYLASLLRDTTVIGVTGRTLHAVREVFEFARLVQPALLVFEDVDLVCLDRSSNSKGSVLGDMMDELDGLRPQEQISVVLTSNAIDRLETAIKDRPGRISQCVRFDPPSAKLRKLYLERTLRDHSTAAVDLDRLVAISEHASQAFLKQWVFRAVQFAIERAGPEAQLETRNFESALAEMKTFADSAASIVGFGRR
jgi:ATP-dependent 26S proteasome regulatory subunit